MSGVHLWAAKKAKKKKLISTGALQIARKKTIVIETKLKKMRLRRIEEIQKMIGEYFHSRANLKVKELEIFDSIEKDEKKTTNKHGYRIKNTKRWQCCSWTIRKNKEIIETSVASLERQTGPGTVRPQRPMATRVAFAIVFIIWRPSFVLFFWQMSGERTLKRENKKRRERERERERESLMPFRCCAEGAGPVGVFQVPDIRRGQQSVPGPVAFHQQPR